MWGHSKGAWWGSLFLAARPTLFASALLVGGYCSPKLSLLGWSRLVHMLIHSFMRSFACSCVCMLFVGFLAAYACVFACWPALSTCRLVVLALSACLLACVFVRLLVRPIHGCCVLHHCGRQQQHRRHRRCDHLHQYRHPFRNNRVLLAIVVIGVGIHRHRASVAIASHRHA